MSEKHFIRMLSIHARKHGLILIRVGGLHDEKSLEVAKEAICELAWRLCESDDDAGLTMCLEEKVVVWARIHP